MAENQNVVDARRARARPLGQVPREDYEVSSSCYLLQDLKFLLFDVLVFRLHRGRLMVCSFWRPIINPAEAFPLAVLDPTSIDYDNDTVAMDQVAPMGAAETLYLKSNPNHRWYWKSNMTPDEAIAFTQYDTHPPEGRFNRM